MRPTVDEWYVGTNNPIKFKITAVFDSGYVEAITESKKCGKLAFSKDTWDDFYSRNLMERIDA